MPFSRGSLNIDFTNSALNVINGQSNLFYSGLTQGDITWDTSAAYFVHLQDALGYALPDDEQPERGNLDNTFPLRGIDKKNGTIGINEDYLRKLAEAENPDFGKIIAAFLAGGRLFIQVKLTKGSKGTPLSVDLSSL